MKLFIQISGLISVLCLLNHAQAEVYQWTDDAGKTHFSDKKPLASGQESDDELEVKTIDAKPVNQFAVDDVLLSDELMKEISPEPAVEELAEKSVEKVDESAKQKSVAFLGGSKMGPEWDWQNGVVRVPAFNSSLTKTKKGEFILRTEITSCKSKSFKGGEEHIMNVNSASVQFVSACIHGQVSHIPQYSKGNRTLHNQFKSSTGSVDIGGVRYGTKGYK
ncbi:MAG: DUF4124 domain-containing protein [Pseudomonadales bacterium]|nr:DUF4124 domain-containing protein [Pseudomonadales bacterium]